MTINAHIALDRGLSGRPPIADPPHKPAEIRRLTNRPRSPSVRLNAEQRGNMRGLVRRDCGRIFVHRLHASPPLPRRVGADAAICGCAFARPTYRTDWLGVADQRVGKCRSTVAISVPARILNSSHPGEYARLSYPGAPKAGMGAESCPKGVLPRGTLPARFRALQFPERGAGRGLDQPLCSASRSVRRPRPNLFPRGNRLWVSEWPWLSGLGSTLFGVKFSPTQFSNGICSR